MSETNVEVVRRAIESARSGPREETTERALALTDPDFVFTSRLTSVEGTT
jgi:hypothetical protein